MSGQVTNNQDIANCPFCDSQLAQQAFLESALSLAIYNIAPILPGHSLVIPKEHVKSLLDLDDIQLSDMIHLARRATHVLMGAFNSSGFDWSVQDGTVAGQTVPHLHLHIVPRRSNDLPESESWYEKVIFSEVKVLDSASRDSLSREELAATVRMLKDYVKAHNL